MLSPDLNVQHKELAIIADYYVDFTSLKESGASDRLCAAALMMAHELVVRKMKACWAEHWRRVEEHYVSHRSLH